MRRICAILQKRITKKNSHVSKAKRERARCLEVRKPHQTAERAFGKCVGLIWHNDDSIHAAIDHSWSSGYDVEVERLRPREEPEDLAGHDPCQPRKISGHLMGIKNSWSMLKSYNEKDVSRWVERDAWRIAYHKMWRCERIHLCPFQTRGAAL